MNTAWTVSYFLFAFFTISRMIIMLSPLRATLLALATASSLVHAAGIEQIDHLVLFMQENRAYDHYFGTLAGTRNFKDPNVQINPDGKSVWYQKVNSSLTTKTDHLFPWYLNYLHGDFDQATQCMEAGSNGWDANHAALNGDLNDNWPLGNTPWSIGHFTRNELPAHFAIAEGWTVGDMYQESVIASTNPNRVSWISGSINAPGGPQSPDEGGMYIDNNETPGCEKPDLNCYPLKWETVPEIWQKQNVTWQVYQDTDNFDDNPLAWFEVFQKSAKGSQLNNRGMTFPGLEKFRLDAAAGTLPQISIIVGPAELSEHPPYTPRDGAWLQASIVEAVTSSPLYKKMALLISYDETGGWGDHVVPYHSPKNTAGEWVEDPMSGFGDVYTGPGFRLPFYIVSPWTRGGHVYVEHADHSSQIKFVEEWLSSKGKDVKTAQIPAWRRANMADLTKAFDFAHPDYTLPSIPNITYPSTDSKGNWNGYSVCESTYKTTRPPVPYGMQNESSSLATEEGFKSVRGQLTEGRYLTFEMNGYALSCSSGKLSASKATSKHDDKSQRFVVHQTGSNFQITDLNKKAVGTFAINDLGAGKGYTLKSTNGTAYTTITKDGKLSTTSDGSSGFSIFSVSYNS